MTDVSSPQITTHDRQVLRDLAKEIRDIAHSDENLEKKDAWYAHNDLKPRRPLVLIESFPATDELVTDDILSCRDDWARKQEKHLRTTIYHFRNIRDDDVIEPYLTWNWHVSAGNYGVTSTRHDSDKIQRVDGKVVGSYSWEAPVKDLDADFGKLKPRVFSVDRESSLLERDRLEDVFGDILGVRQRGGYWWTTGMTIIAIDLIGLENLMLAMYDNPAGLHRLMGFLRDDHIAFAEWLEKEGLLSLNNENDYIGSGSRGYTRELPQKDWKPGGKVRTRDCWVLSESQETVGVGPGQFEEFIFPYQKDVVERFGLCYYGCCEPVHSRWHVIKKFSNLRSVSVSPWCDEEMMGEALAGKYVYSRKPNPTLISTDVFDENAIRNDVAKTLRCARKCSVEIVMKDVHTLAGDPMRAARWVELARQAIDLEWGK